MKKRFFAERKLLHQHAEVGLSFRPLFSETSQGALCLTWIQCSGSLRFAPIKRLLHPKG